MNVRLHLSYLNDVLRGCHTLGSCFLALRGSFICIFPLFSGTDYHCGKLEASLIFLSLVSTLFLLPRCLNKVYPEVNILIRTCLGVLMSVCQGTLLHHMESILHSFCWVSVHQEHLFILQPSLSSPCTSFSQITFIGIHWTSHQSFFHDSHSI